MENSLEQTIKDANGFDRMIDMITTMVYSGVPDNQLPIHKLVPYLTKENIIRVSLAMYAIHNTPPDEVIMITENHVALHKRMYDEAVERAKSNQPGKSEEFLNSMKNMINKLGEDNDRQTEGSDGDVRV